MPDPRRSELCVYSARQLWWTPILTFLLRDGSRNAFDANRNSGQIPQNVLALSLQTWDADRLGQRPTVTCSQNAIKHAGRVPVTAVAALPVKMIKRLMDMRLLESARLFNHWWLVVVDGTLRDRGRGTSRKRARFRYTVEAKLVGPEGTLFPLMNEFRDMHDPAREKEDCELNAFRRLSQRLHEEFPRLPMCLLADGLYAVQSVFDITEDYGWKFIASLKEGRQRLAWEETVQTMGMSPSLVQKARFKLDGHWVAQTFRWTKQIPFGKNHAFDVLFNGEIGPSAATLWAWVTNFELTHENVLAIGNQGGRARQGIETSFNVEKNGGFGLEHAFCADTQASQNYHLMMLVAHILEQLLVNGLLRRLLKAFRKVSDRKIIELLRTSLLTVLIDKSGVPSFGQIRFCSSA